ncbi:hypothetical protein METP3_02820 [Methanosarcinales archaeon]|nr:hypothetical protein METP3_02820 [Methanosarcinales archaeon]
MIIDNRKTIRGKGWKRPYNISSDKYAIISKAILKVLTSKPVKFGELVAKVEEEVGTFPGSVEWYMLSSLRELESEGKVIRTMGKIVTYHKSNRSR